MGGSAPAQPEALSLRDPRRASVRVARDGRDDEPPASSTRDAVTQSHLAWAGAGPLHVVIDPSAPPAAAACDVDGEAAAVFGHVWRLAQRLGAQLRSGRPRSLELSGERAWTRCEAADGSLVVVRGELTR
jgi:hypothetical protein